MSINIFKKNRHYKGHIGLKKRFHEKNNQNFNATFVKKTLPNDDFELEKKKMKNDFIKDQLQRINVLSNVWILERPIWSKTKVLNGTQCGN